MTESTTRAAATRARRVSTGGASGTPTAPEGDGVRVLCVDDHAVLVEGLKAQFAVDGRVRVVGRLATAEKLLDEVERLHPRVVLLDIEMPGPDAFEMADRLRHLHPQARVIFLSAHIRDRYLNAAYKCGAWGYFAKGDELEDIVAGVKQVAAQTSSASGRRSGSRRISVGAAGAHALDSSAQHRGAFVMGPKVKAHCALPRAGSHGRSSSAEAAPRTALDALTPREIEVLRLIGKGLSRTQIAKELCRSAKTIDGHQERILKKLGVESRAELMRLAIREGFAEA